MHVMNLFSKWASFAAIALLGAAISVSAGEVRQGTAVVKAVTGSASYVDELGLNHPLAVGSVVREGLTIKTGTASSVDLDLGANGPGIALTDNSTLRLDKLTTQPSAFGPLIDTRLSLLQGTLYGQVDKLLPGSRYEVQMPTGLVTVRGTTFYLDAQTGTVFVTQGTVKVTVNLNVGTSTLTTTVNVGTGQELSIARHFKSAADFYALSASPAPPGLTATTLKRLAQLGLLVGPRSGNELTENFEATQKKNGQITIEKPPTSIVVSQ